MKHLKPFLESYRDIDRNKYKNEYDYDFAQYALNERPLRWDADDIIKCSDIYGNKEVGTVYHGNRINSEDLLDSLEDIKRRIGKERVTLNMRLKSTSPYKDDAESFALYVKSYDEMTTFRMVAQAVENGSAGQYGGYLLTLKPTPDQVVLATFGGGKYPTSSAETEALVNGEIEVLDLEIFYPMNKDTYLQQFSDLGFSALFNDLYNRWFSKHKLPRPDSGYIVNLLKRITTESQAIDFTKKLSSGGFVFGYIDLKEFLQIPALKSLLKYVASYKDGGLCFHFPDGKNIGVETYKGLYDYLAKMPKYKQQLNSVMEEILTRPYTFTNEIKYTPDNEPYSMYFQLDSNAHLILSALQKMKEAGIKKKHPLIDEINAGLKETLSTIIVGKHLRDTTERTLYALDSYLNSLSYETKYLVGIIDTDYIVSAMRYFYSDFAHRYNGGKDGASSLNQYSRCLAYALKIMTSF